MSIVITNQMISIMKFIYKKKSVSFYKLSKKFKSDDLKTLLETLIYNNYVIQVGGSINCYGEPKEIVNDTLFQVSASGIAEIESHQWFNFQYIITSVIVPIVVGTLSSILTAILLSLF